MLSRKRLGIILAALVAVVLGISLVACSSSKRPVAMAAPAPLLINGHPVCVYEIDRDIECGPGSPEYTAYGSLYGTYYVQAVAPGAYNEYGTDQADLVWSYLLFNRSYYSSPYYTTTYISHTHTTVAVYNQTWGGYTKNYSYTFKTLPAPSVSKPAPVVSPSSAIRPSSAPTSSSGRSNQITNTCAAHGLLVVQDRATAGGGSKPTSRTTTSGSGSKPAPAPTSSGNRVGGC